MKMKRKMSILLLLNLSFAMMLTMLLLAGCGTSTTGTSGTPVNETATATASLGVDIPYPFPTNLAGPPYTFPSEPINHPPNTLATLVTGCTGNSYHQKVIKGGGNPATRTQSNGDGDSATAIVFGIYDNTETFCHLVAAGEYIKDKSGELLQQTFRVNLYRDTNSSVSLCLYGPQDVTLLINNDNWIDSHNKSGTPAHYKDTKIHYYGTQTRYYPSYHGRAVVGTTYTNALTPDTGCLSG